MSATCTRLGRALGIVSLFFCATAGAQTLGDYQLDGQVAAASCCDLYCGDQCCSDACCEDVCCSSRCDDGLLWGLIKPSDHCFDDFISPMTNPVFFEDPRTLTEARGVFLNHKVPLVPAAGGEIQVYALQLRAALTERLSLIATKDGYAVSSNPLIRDGWVDVALGLKYNLLRNVCDQRLLSAGFTYEMPVGSRRTLQGNGDGEWHLFLIGGTEFLDYGHWISGSGFRLPSDPGDESSMWYWSNHFDYQVLDGWYALTEFNWYNWIGAGAGGIPGVEGGDLFNFGSSGVAGNDIVTGAFGGKYKPNGHVEIGVAWELPLTERRDVLENRLTVDLILRY